MCYVHLNQHLYIKVDKQNKHNQKGQTNMYRTSLTIRQIRAYNAFLKNCSIAAKSDDLVHLYESMIIRIKPGQIGQSVLKG